jgi:hypothetical protein
MTSWLQKCLLTSIKLTIVYYYKLRKGNQNIFDVCKSLHHHTIQINQPTRCNSFTSLLLDVYVWINMFRASPRPSSGAYNCNRSLWFYCGAWRLERWSWSINSFIFDVHKPVHYHTIQIIQPTRCNSFTSLLLDVYVWINMFRASLRPSSGAYNCTGRLWFNRWREAAAGALLVVVWQATTNNAVSLGWCFPAP